MPAGGSWPWPAGPRPDQVSPDDERDLNLDGLLIFVDAPKTEARQALDRLAELGVTVKVITGDHPAVAVRVCRVLGLDGGGVLTGGDLAGLGDEALWATVAQTTPDADTAHHTDDPKPDRHTHTDDRHNSSRASRSPLWFSDRCSFHDCALSAQQETSDHQLLALGLLGLTCSPCSAHRSFPRTSIQRGIPLCVATGVTPASR
jgi:hypothetical protein